MTRALRVFLVRARTLVRTALAGLRASPLPSFVAGLTIAVTLVLGGTFGVVVKNMEQVLGRVGEEVGVTAYLAADVSPEAALELVARVEQAPGVASVRFVSREQAAQRFAARGSERADWLDALGENPLPASLEIALAPERRTREGVRAVAAQVRSLPGIEDVGSEDDWVEGYARALAFVRAAGLALGAVLGLATMLLVANTIRLALYARRDEIGILSLVGASRTFIAIPFLLEGALQGFAGGVVALALLALGFRVVHGAIALGLAFVLGGAEPVFLSAGDAALLVAAGAALGALGAAVSLAGGWRS